MKMRAPDEIRVLDADGFKRRAACLCLRDAPRKNGVAPGVTSPKEILLISSAKKADKWMVPGGGVDPGEDLSTAAARETFEEAGVRGRLDGLVGVFETTSGTRTRTHVFKLVVEEVADTWAESARKRRWFSLEEAKKVLESCKPAQKEYLDKYSSLVKSQWEHHRLAARFNGSGKLSEETPLPVKDLDLFVSPHWTKEPQESPWAKDELPVSDTDAW